ncbi:MAG TPA: hypothetical protein VJ161_10930 [Geobacteraceae bacterium]|nr:hypothetical protein [Geobacteraceae bacterium]
MSKVITIAIAALVSGIAGLIQTSLKRFVDICYSNANPLSCTGYD